MNGHILVEHRPRAVNLGGGFRIVLGQPEPRDGHIVVPAVCQGDPSGDSFHVEVHWRGDAQFSLHNADGDPSELPRGCDQWALAAALRDECAHLL